MSLGVLSFLSGKAATPSSHCVGTHDACLMETSRPKMARPARGACRTGGAAPRPPQAGLGQRQHGAGPEQLAPHAGPQRAALGGALVQELVGALEQAQQGPADHGDEDEVTDEPRQHAGLHDGRTEQGPEPHPQPPAPAVPRADHPLAAEELPAQGGKLRGRLLHVVGRQPGGGIRRREIPGRRANY